VRRSHWSSPEFQPSDLIPGLKSRAVSGSVVSTLAHAAEVLLNLAVIMILARLLAPPDFGLIAMAMMGFLRIFKVAGLSIATIQREAITHAQVSNLFWINVIFRLIGICF